MSVVVTGSREWPSEGEDKVHRMLDVVLKYDGDPLLLVHGGARGADSAAERWYVKTLDLLPPNTLVRKRFPARWGQYGRQGKGDPAGQIRNQEMLDWVLEDEQTNDFGDPIVLAFPLPEVQSRGTYNCIQAARAKGIPVFDCSVTTAAELTAWFTDERWQ